MVGYVQKGQTLQEHVGKLTRIIIIIKINKKNG